MMITAKDERFTRIRVDFGNISGYYHPYTGNKECSETMNRKSCFFIGHREADERLLPELIAAVERLITEEQVSCFYVGSYGGFDRIAASAVKQAKRHHPEVTLMLVLPYHPAEHPVETPYGFDGTYYPEGLEMVPRRYAIMKANRIMVDSSDWLIAYVRHGVSNSRKILEYAQRRGNIRILRIGPKKTPKITK